MSGTGLHRFFEAGSSNLGNPVPVSELKRLQFYTISERELVALKTRGRSTPSIAAIQECSSGSAGIYM